ARRVERTARRMGGLGRGEASIVSYHPCADGVAVDAGGGGVASSGCTRRYTLLASSTAGTMRAASASRSIHPYVPSQCVRNTGRRPGTSTVTRWIAALATTARRSGTLTMGRIANTLSTGLLQLHAWKSGESASSENASARVRLSEASLCPCVT